MNIIKNKKIIYIIVALIFSAIFLLIFSPETSPIRNSCFGDSANYRFEGILTRKGMTPYVDFFEHKGPFIFVIQALGCLFTYDRIGIYIVEVLFFAVSLCGGYKICRLYFNERQSLVMVFAITLANEVFRSSNLTEEYSMPFLMWSTYFITKYFKSNENGNVDYNVKYAFFNGVSVMACIMIRMTNALPICLLILAGAMDLITKKKWKNIFDCIVSFTLGMLVVLVPFIIWFASKDALYDMFYGTIIHNIKYSINANDILMNSGLEYIILFNIEFIITLIACIYAIKKNNKKKFKIIISIICIIGFVFQLSLRAYLHYEYIWLPIYVIGYCILAEGFLENRSVAFSIEKIIVESVEIICIGVLLTCFGSMMIREVKTDTQSVIDIENDARQINSMIPKESKNKVLAYNVNSQFYITTNIIPCYKYWIWQDWMCSVNDNMQEEFKEYIESGRAEYIVENGENNIYNENDGTDNKLDYIIDGMYEEIGRNDSFVLMKKK